MKDFDIAKKFSFDVSWVFFSSIITLVIGFLIRPIIGRWLGAEALGIYSILLTIQAIVMIFAGFGIPQALIKYIAQYKDNHSDTSTFASTGILISLIFGIIWSLLIFLLSGEIGRIFGILELKENLQLFCFVFPILSFYNTQIGIFNGFRKMKLFASLVIFNEVIRTILIIGFVALGYGIKGAVLGIILSYLISSVFIGIPLLRKYISFTINNFLDNAKKLIPFGGKLATAISVNEINNRLDIILVGYFLLATSVGYYSVSLALSKFFWFIPLSIQRVTFPATSEFWANGSQKKLETMANTTLKYSSILMVLIGLIIWFFGQKIILLLFGNEFLPALIPLKILIIGTVIRGSIAQPIGSNLAAIGKPEINIKISLIIIFFNIIADLVLIPIYGISGAALATSMSLIIGTIAILWMNKRYLLISFKRDWAIKIIVFLISIALIREIFEFIINNNYIFDIFIICFYLIFVYFFITNYIERKIIFRIIRLMLLKVPLIRKINLIKISKLEDEV